MDLEKKLVVIKDREYERLYRQYTVYLQTYNVSIINQMIFDIRYMLYKEAILTKSEVVVYGLLYYVLGKYEPDPTKWDLSKSNMSILSMIKFNLNRLQNNGKIEIVTQ